jgi:hypothetical protein
VLYDRNMNIITPSFLNYLRPQKATFTLLSLLSVGTSQAVTKFDFNTDGSTTQTDWTAAPLGAGTDGTVSIATTAIGAVTVDSRDRSGANGGGDQSEMWQDFIFANGSFGEALDTGLNLVISGLEADSAYEIKLWGFDSGSGVQADGFERAADWTDGADGTGILAFDATEVPDDLTQHRLVILAQSNASGTIALDGIVAATDPSSSHNVFLNGLEVSDPVLDTDSDGLPDDFEQLIIAADVNDAITTLADVLPGDDFDDDGSTNENELARETDPVNEDSDDDLFKDGVEDKGGIWVSAEQTGTDPLKSDTDGDTILDGTENHALPYDPNNPLTQPGTDPNSVDTDGDLFPDDTELADGTDPTDPNSFLDPFANATAKFDFNDGSAITLAGWTSADLGNGTDGSVTVATEAVGGVTVDSRDRTDANTDTGDVSRNDLWRDFVFANGSFDSVPGSGLKITLTGLVPSTSYPITIWAFDEASNNGRDADWGPAGETAATLSFPTSPDPASLSDYMVSFEAGSDASGTLVIEGLVAIENPDASHNVFINALFIGLPTGSTGPEITLIEYDSGTVALTFKSRPGKFYAIDQSNDLLDFSEEVDDNVEGAAGASSTRFEFDATDFGKNSFYRVRELP